MFRAVLVEFVQGVEDDEDFGEGVWVDVVEDEVSFKYFLPFDRELKELLVEIDEG